MVDAVESGGYGVLGLYAVQAPVVPASPPQPPATTATDAAAPAIVAIEPAKALGSGPVAASDPGADGAATSGREFSEQGQSLARQAAVAVSLAGAAASGAAEARPTGQAGAGLPTTSSGRAFRAYARTGDTKNESRAGAMLSAKV